MNNYVNDIQKSLDQMPDWFKEEYSKGKSVVDILYNIGGIPNRLPTMQEKIDNLFSLIDNNEKEKAVQVYNDLVAILGEDDPAMVQASIELKYSF